MKNIKVFEFISGLTLFLVFFSILFLNWYNNTNPSYFLVFGVFALIFLILINKKISKANFKIFLYVFIFILYIFINIILTNNHTYFWESMINYTFIPFMSAIFYLIIKKNNDYFINNKLLKWMFIAFNLYYFINSIITIIQIYNPGFLVHNWSNNTFYLDQICGFIGTNGTGRLMLFNIICIFINYIMINNIRFKKISKIMLTYIIISSCYISIYNDSRMYFFLLLLFLFPLFFENERLKKKSRNFNKIIILVVIFIIFSFIYLVSDDVHEIVYNKLINPYINRTINNVNISNLNNSSEERIVLIKRIINKTDNIVIGNGIGSISHNGNEINRHLGLNDYNIRLYSGGIVYVILITIIYNIVFSSYCKSRMNFYNKIYNLIIIIILAFYTQIFTYVDKSFLISTIFYLNSIILCNDRGDNNEKNRNYNLNRL